MLTYDVLTQAAVNFAWLCLWLIGITTMAGVIGCKLLEIAEREYCRARRRSNARRMKT